MCACNLRFDPARLQGSIAAVLEVGSSVQNADLVVSDYLVPLKIGAVILAENNFEFR